MAIKKQSSVDLEIFTDVTQDYQLRLMRIEVLEAEPRAAETELTQFAGFIARWERLTEADRERSEPESLTDLGKVRNPPREVVGRVAREIILEAGRPIPRGELFVRLRERGVRIFGKAPQLVFTTMMWRMQNEFVRLARFGYWPRDKAFPPANHEPNRPMPSRSKR